MVLGRLFLGVGEGIAGFSLSLTLCVCFSSGTALFSSQVCLSRVEYRSGAVIRPRQHHGRPSVRLIIGRA
jgi:hypothetical protein